MNGRTYLIQYAVPSRSLRNTNDGRSLNGMERSAWASTYTQSVPSVSARKMSIANRTSVPSTNSEKDNSTPGSRNDS